MICFIFPSLIINPEINIKFCVPAIFLKDPIDSCACTLGPGYLSFLKRASESENYNKIRCLSKVLLRARNLRHSTTTTRTATITPATATTAGTILVPLSEENTVLGDFIEINYVITKQMNNIYWIKELIYIKLITPFKSKGEHGIDN